MHASHPVAMIGAGIALIVFSLLAGSRLDAIGFLGLVLVEAGLLHSIDTWRTAS